MISYHKAPPGKGTLKSDEQVSNGLWKIVLSCTVFSNSETDRPFF